MAAKTTPKKRGLLDWMLNPPTAPATTPAIAPVVPVADPATELIDNSLMRSAEIRKRRKRGGILSAMSGAGDTGGYGAMTGKTLLGA